VQYLTQFRIIRTSRSPKITYYVLHEALHPTHSFLKVGKQRHDRGKKKGRVLCMAHFWYDLDTIR